MHVKQSITFNKTQPQNRAVIFCMYYLICITLLDCIFSGTPIVSIFSYSSILIELVITIYIIYCNGWKLRINISGIISIIILTSCLLFTMLNAGFKSSIFALFKEYNIVFVCVILSGLKYDKSVINQIIKIFVLFGLSSLVFSILFEDFIAQAIHASNAYTVEIESFFSNKNQFGRVLYMSAVAAFMYYVNEEHRSVYLVITVILSFATVFSFSRTSLVALMFFYGTYYILKSKMSVVKRFLVLFCIIIFFLVIFSNENIVEYVNRIIVRKDADLSSRMNLCNIGLEYTYNHPFFGAGEYMAENIINSKGLFFSEFHSEYIYRLVVSGIPITILYGFIIYVQMKRLFKQRYTNSYAIVAFSGFISFMVYMCFEQYPVYRFSIEGMILATLLYMIPNINMKNERNVNE